MDHPSHSCAFPLDRLTGLGKQLRLNGLKTCNPDERPSRRQYNKECLAA